MKVYVVVDMNADSWSGTTYLKEICLTLEDAIEYLKKNYHHAHHEPNHYWWEDSERPVSEETVQHTYGKKVKDYIYFAIFEKDVVTYPVSV